MEILLEPTSNKLMVGQSLRICSDKVLKLKNFEKDESKSYQDNQSRKKSDQVKEGVGYNAVPLAAADLYLSPKKDLS
nr:hypothetical protein [Tanacetum cinerariifolium]